MDNQTVFRVSSILGLTSTFYLSGFGFSASHLTIPPLLVAARKRDQGSASAGSTDVATTKQALSVFRYVFQQGKPLFIALATVSILSSATASYMATRLALSSSSLPSLTASRFGNVNFPATFHALSGVFVASTLPLTQIFMMPGILTLVACEENDSTREKVGEKKIKGLLREWMDRNYLRSGLLLVAGCLGGLGVFLS